jgi:hypothetical protein
MEDPLDGHVSQGLVEIDREEEFSHSSSKLSGANDDVGAIGFKLASSTVLSFPFDWRHEMERVFVERLEIALIALQFEYTNCSIVQGLSEWILQVLPIDWKTTTCLSHGDHEFSIVSWSHEELWVLSVSVQKIFLVSAWDTTRVGLGPLGLESNTSPILWEVNVQEQGAELILPVIIAHHEGSIVGVQIELLIWRKSLNVLLEDLSVLLHFCRFTRPCASPLRVTPRVSESKHFKWDLASFVKWILKFHDVIDSIGVIQDQASWGTIKDQLTLFAITLDTATQEAHVTLSLHEEIPEAFLASIVLFDHLVREKRCFLVSNQDLFRLESSEFLDTFIDVS